MAPEPDIRETSAPRRPFSQSSTDPISGTIRRESAFNVRGRQNNDISNTQALGLLAC